MKRMSKALFLWGIVAVLTACGNEASPTGNLAQNINMGSGGSGNAEKGGNEEKESGGNQESETSDQGKQKEEEGTFGFVYEGVTLIPGEVFDPSVLPGYAEVSEVPSCAFDGSDNVYNYEAFELTAYIEGNAERIYAIYFIDPNLPTTEGLCLGDDVENMKSLYGENYEADGTAYTYMRGDTLLSIITKNDIVVSIEYRLNK